MFFDNFDINDLLPQETNVFTVDVKTILGKNIVKNFIGKIKLELSMMGYSDSANDIASYYEECKKTGGIIKFVTSPVIKMILKEIESYPSVKNYLYDRIFDDIELEKTENLEKVFNDEDLFEETQQKEHEYKVNKEIKRKAIAKIQKDYKCSYEKAVEIYEKKQIKDIDKMLIKSLNNFLSTSDKTDFVEFDGKKITDFDKDFEEIIREENQEIDLNEEPNLEIPFTENDSFWGE